MLLKSCRVCPETYRSLLPSTVTGAKLLTYRAFSGVRRMASESGDCATAVEAELVPLRKSLQQQVCAYMHVHSTGA